MANVVKTIYWLLVNVDTFKVFLKVSFQGTCTVLNRCYGIFLCQTHRTHFLTCLKNHVFGKLSIYKSTVFGSKLKQIFLSALNKMGFARNLLPIFVLLIVQATVNSNAQCPAPKAVNNFNATAFAGRWYEIQHFKQVITGFCGTCASFNFTVNSENNITFGLNYYILGQQIATRDRAVVITNGTFSWKFTVPVVQSNFLLICVLIINFISFFLCT